LGFPPAGGKPNSHPADTELTQAARERLIRLALDAASGAGDEPLRRSRHATTYRVRWAVKENRLPAEIYVKIFDVSRGFASLKERVRGSKAVNMARMLAALKKAGFGVPSLLMLGRERATGRSMAVTTAAEGDSLAEVIARDGPGAIARKRTLLRALGQEVARFHRAGFIHGDLTPHNVFVGDGAAVQFTFIDHDRTQRAARRGPRRGHLRNLVQLGRFEFEGLTRSDRMRFFRAYADTLELGAGKSAMRRVAKMLAVRQTEIARTRGRRALDHSS
ncbi:MAG TPA: lipopolysaccharide kinase InaA family protein, partial [Candidatus Binataceae bacterium]|nr:lipopolysaccharide kinase InaA family protein [Candidatus Binataceae bacterium]